jgi:Gas vesicle synthesis protein GvpL/GvpF
MENSELALYLFCFARSDAVREVPKPAADIPSFLAILRYSPELCAVTGEVRREEFAGPEAELNLQQLSWVGPRALRHEAVIEEVMASSPVLPARFGTLFSSAEALAEFAGQHREKITQFLDRVAGHGEWSVKGVFASKLRRRLSPQRWSRNGSSFRRCLPARAISPNSASAATSSGN